MKELTLKNIFFNKISIFVIFFILLLDNCYMGFNSYLDYFVKYSSLIIAILLLIIYIFDKNKNKFINVFLLYGVSIFISCCLGTFSNIKNFIGTYSSIIAMCLYLNYAIVYKCKESIKTLNNIYLLLIIINFCTLLIFPKGMYKTSLYSTNWFFKYDNVHMYMYFPAMLIGYINLQMQDNDKKLKIVWFMEIFLVAFGVLFCHSATTMVSCAVLVIYLLCKKAINTRYFFNAKNYLIIYVVTFFTIVVYRLQNIFSWFIVGVLKKDLTFTTRTVLWDRIVKYIYEKPIIGYGIENTEVFRKKMKGEFYTHAHNTTYDILYKGGILALFFHIVLLIESAIELCRYRNNEISRVASIFFFGVLITMNFEAREEKMGLYIILYICFSIGTFVKNALNNKGEVNEK